MPTVNRQIAVTQARQGGFSAHVLPGPVSYPAPVAPVIAYATPGGFEVIGTYESVNIPTPVSGLISSSGGPFGEPATNAVNQSSLYSISLGSASPGIGDFTLEWWFRVVSLNDGGQFNMMSMFGSVGSSTAQLRWGNSSAPSLFRSVVSNGNGIFTWTLTWSAPVTGFTAEDVTVTDGTLLTFAANSETVYTVVVEASESLAPGSAPDVLVTGEYSWTGANTQQTLFDHSITAGGQRTTQSIIQLSAWNHAAIVRSEDDHRAYINGSLVTNEVFSLGYEGIEPINFSNVTILAKLLNRFSIGQMRYTKGVALYSGTSSTVPTEPFFVP